MRAKSTFAGLFTFVALAASQSDAQTLNTLVSFDGTDGEYPTFGSLTISGSTLYGATTDGGTHLSGNVFSVPVTGGTPTNLFSFNGVGSGSDGFYPGGVTLSGSTLFGMTGSGGADNYGTVFGIPVTGGAPTTLVSFNGVNGAFGGDALTLSGSTLYGTTAYSDAPNEGGTVFSMPATGGSLTVLASFNNTDGTSPNGVTVGGSTLYGMTESGGIGFNGNAGSGDGTIFSVPAAGGTPTVLASFNGTDGANPYGDLTLVGSTLYGMTSAGGQFNDGTIFSIPVAGGTPTILLSFNGANGASPQGDLTLFGSTLYGMTSAGGQYSDGTIFSIPLNGGLPTTLANFNGTNGESPYGNLTASGSTLYGMTDEGGTHNRGTVFALSLVPEPSSAILFALGAVGLAAAAGHHRARKKPA